MRGIRNTVILGAVTAVALVGIGTGTALADPPSGTVPALTDIVGVGSDTVTPLFSGSQRLPAGDPHPRGGKEPRGQQLRRLRQPRLP
jgi:hypothetical protein